eukprot:jgi/Mesen1/3139/ME000184S02206
MAAAAHAGLAIAKISIVDGVTFDGRKGIQGGLGASSNSVKLCRTKQYGHASSKLEKQDGRSINAEGGLRTVRCAANLNDVAVGSATVPPTQPDTLVATEPAPEAHSSSDIQEPSLFIADVSNLIKLVDSRDIVELELKHKNYEILIRKKEALPVPSPAAYQTYPGPHVMAHTAIPTYTTTLQDTSAQQGAAPATAPAASEPAAAPEAPAGPVPSSLPPMRSPMAGTFYRSPAPGEPAFVKVGDRVQKGQVVCIVEAMKLMNEIEADQSGVIREILLDDGKPVAIDIPLFTIEP